MKEKVFTQTNMSEMVIGKGSANMKYEKINSTQRRRRLPTSHTIMRVDRLLSMLLIISGKGTVTGKELAEHFEVSLRTIYRDIEKIGEAGIPIASSSGKGGGYYIMDSYNITSLFLNRVKLIRL